MVFAPQIIILFGAISLVVLLCVTYGRIRTSFLAENQVGGPKNFERRALIGDDWFVDDSTGHKGNGDSGCGDDVFSAGDDKFRGMFQEGAADDSSTGCEDDIFLLNDDNLQALMQPKTLNDDDLINFATLVDDFSSFDDDAEIDNKLTLSIIEADENEIPTANGFFKNFTVTNEAGTAAHDGAATTLEHDLEVLFGGKKGNKEEYEKEQQLMFGRIVGGTVAGGRRYPYIVSLLNVMSTPSGLRAFHACGGSLITPDVVLSAAHCVTSSLQFAQVGKYHRHANHNRPHTVETMKIEQKLMHPRWDETTFENDLVLIKLGKKSQRQNNLVRITKSDLTSGESVKVMGWGKTSSGGRLSSILRHVTVKYMTNEKCSSSLYNYGTVIKDTMMCANNGPADACQGDSGGPMVRQDKDDSDNPEKDTQVGVVSWGFGCSFAKYPGVYSRMDVEWIEEAVCDPVTGLSPDECAGPGQLYPAEVVPPPTDPPATETETTAAEFFSYQSLYNVGFDETTNESKLCADRTDVLISRSLLNLTCERVKKLRSFLCYYHRDDCPETCCPGHCDPATGKCGGDPSHLP